jgi:hypothetical protein
MSTKEDWRLKKLLEEIDAVYRRREFVTMAELLIQYNKLKEKYDTQRRKK